MFARKYINMILAGAAGSNAISVLRSNATIAAEWELEASGLIQDDNIAACHGYDHKSKAGTFTCNQDDTHRVCAQLMDGGNKVMWGNDKKDDFWHITKQGEWHDKVGSNSKNTGGDWCICMWATAELIEKVGCDNVHIDCDATDVSYVMDHYTDKGTSGVTNLKVAHECLHSKCNA